ncbi:MAG: flagellar motor switch protein FliN [Nitrospirae bacterium]|nr:flagellar motor switch protein FliN [Candidatus Troglogloeales bacterium]
MAEETEARSVSTEEADPAPEIEEGPEPSQAEEKSGRPVTFADLEQKPTGSKLQTPGNINILLDVPLKVTVLLGSTKMLIKELLHLGHGSIIELSKIAGDPMDICIGEKLIARGEVVVVNDMFGVRIIDIVSPEERVETLNK